MKYAIDTEFLEGGRSLTLLSLGLAAEDGREYYAEVEDVDHTRANDWVRANVLVHLGKSPQAIKSRAQIRSELIAFVGNEKPIFWGWYAAYDWVLFTQLIGDFETYGQELPQWPLMCFDLQHASVMMDRPLIVPKALKHQALDDARWVMSELRRLGL